MADGAELPAGAGADSITAPHEALTQTTQELQTQLLQPWHFLCFLKQPKQPWQRFLWHLWQPPQLLHTLQELHETVQALEQTTAQLEQE